jgi:phosphoribosylglycinamide formyltransferase-1
MSLRIAVMISGAGSNLLAIDDACRAGRVAGAVVGVLSDRGDAAGLTRARSRGLLARSLPIEPGETRAAHDARILAALESLQPAVVVLAGYMRILSSDFVTALRGRLLNIHPSLLPRHKGLHTHRRVLEAAEREHGATVHYVTPDLDGGPAVLQARIAVGADDDADSLAHRVQRCEHVIYPTVLQWVASGRLQCPAGVPMLDGVPLLQPIVQDFDV